MPAKRALLPAAPVRGSRRGHHRRGPDHDDVRAARRLPHPRRGQYARGFRRPRTLTGMLQRQAAGNPGGVPVIIPSLPGVPDTFVTYAEIHRRALAVAAYLEDRTDVGDRVLIASPAGLDFLAGLFGAMLAGCIPVPVPPPARPPLAARCDDIIRDCEPSHILVGGGLHGLFPGSRTPVGYISVPGGVPAGWAPSHVPGPGDVAYIQYTSGTAGPPEGALITHDAALAGLRGTAAHMRLLPGTRCATWLPPWQDPGLTALLLILYARCTAVVTQPDDWIADPVGWLGEMSRRRVEAAPLPSFACQHLVTQLKQATADRLAALDLSSWRLAWTDAPVAGPDGPAAFTDMLAGCGLRGDLMRDLYGFAEAAGAVTGGRHRQVTVDPGHLAAGKVVPAPSGGGVRLPAAGRPLPGTRLKIRQLDGAWFAWEGEIGEVVVQGRQLAAGYWRGPGPWTTIAGERWLATGDAGALLPDGSLVLAGRVRDLITAGGRRVVPAVLEQAAAHAAGDAVRADTVAAFQDDDGGVIIAAEPHSGRADLNTAAKAITAAVESGFGITLAGVVFPEQGTIATTTSCKLSRRDLAERWRTAGGPARIPAQPERRGT